MGVFSQLRRFFRTDGPEVVDYEAQPQYMGNDAPVGEREYAATGTDGPNPAVLRRVGPGAAFSEPNHYKLQQSYDSLLQTVQELRSALDGQRQRQEEMLSRLGTLPHAVETLPQTSKMQAEMLQVINDQLAMHSARQRRIGEMSAGLAGGGKDYGEMLRGIREQIETGNEIDRQLVESFNRFSIMIDRLQVANHHAVECLGQVRDSCAISAMQMHEWVEKTRVRGTWMLNGAFAMALIAFLIAMFMLIQHL